MTAIANPGLAKGIGATFQAARARARGMSFQTATVYMTRLDGIEREFPDSLRDVPLASLAEAECIAAIEQATRFIDTSLEEGIGSPPGLWIRFVTPGRVLYEDDFYEHVRNNCPRAVSALRGLIERFTARWDWEYASGGIFAAYALAYLDVESLPLVARHFRVIDAEHNGEFDGEKVQALVAHHGWSLRMVDFVIAWLAQTTNNWVPGTDGRGLDVYGYDVAPNWWIAGGLREAAKVLMIAPAFAQHCLNVLVANNAGPRPPELAGDGFYFGCSVVEGFYIEYYETAIGRPWQRQAPRQVFSPGILGALELLQEGLDRRRGGAFGKRDAVAESFATLLDDESWEQVARPMHLCDWDREFFVEFKRLASETAPLNQSD